MIAGADLAKKRLPAWIRDGLAKAGHDLQKKMYEGLVNKHQSAVQDVHDQEDHSVIEMEVVKEVRVDDIGARRISGYEQTVSRSPSPPTDKVGKSKVTYVTVAFHSRYFTLINCF